MQPTESTPPDAHRGPPSVAPGAFVHPAALVCGTVTLAEGASVWGGAIVRGDTETITIGADTNLQDHVMVHADPGVPTTIGARVTVGHRAVVHGATIEDDVLVGIGAILLNGVHVGTGSVIGAGALCPEGMVVPPGSLVLGVPGKVVRATSDAERARIARGARTYRELAARHADGSIRYHDGRPLLPGVTSP
jgi:carbonic anhydrase/acetyltransferase-like protein (isoleucine patch superfamily)